MALETPSRPKPATSPARCTSRCSASGRPSSGGRRVGQRRDRGRVPEGVRRLQVDEPPDGGQRVVALRRDSVRAERRARRRSPHPTSRGRRGRGRPSRRRRTTTSTSAGSNCVPDRRRARSSARRRRPSGARPRGTRPAGRCATRSGSASPDSLTREPLAVPPLVRTPERGEHVVVETELLAERSRQLGVSGDHAVELLAPRHREVEPDSQPVQRRARRSRASGASSTMSAALNGSASYLVAFMAMSSPNQ